MQSAHKLTGEESSLPEPHWRAFGLCPQDDVVPTGKREVAKVETERLKSQARQKKEMLERMREQQNSLATMADVRGAPLSRLPSASELAAVPPVALQHSL